MSPTIVFYVVLVLWTLFNLSSRRTYAYVAPHRRAAYGVIDKPTWIVAAVLLGLIPRWWGWVTTSYVGAVLVPLVGLILVGSVVLFVLEEIATFPSLTGRRKMLRVMAYMICATLILGLLWLIRYIVS